MLFLSVDIGTSSLKAAVMEEDTRVLASYRETYCLRTQGVRAEIDPRDILCAFEKTAREAFRFFPEIQGVCFDSFAPSVLLLDEAGEPLTPIITHLDRRSRAESAELMEALPSMLQTTGVLPYAGGVSITTLKWLQRNEEALFRSAFHFGHVNTYLFHKLTGLWGMDGVNASMTGLFRTFGEGWDDEILDRLHMPRRLCPDIVEPWDGGWALCPTAAERLGAASTVRVWMGTQDVSAAQVGAGNETDGRLLITSGSSEMLSLLSQSPKPDPSYYTRRAAAPGLWQMFAIGIGGFALEWFRKVFCREMTETAFYEEYIPQILSRMEETTVRFSPYLAGDRHSMKIKQGALNGLTLNTSRDDILSAVLTGIQEPLVNAIATWKKQGVTIAREVQITGNLAQLDAYLAFKEKQWGEHTLRRVEGSPLAGNVRLAVRSLE